MKKSSMFLCGLLLSFFAFQAFGQQFPVFYNQGIYTGTLVYCNVHGSGFFDYNNDGWDDIFVVKNHSEERDPYYANSPNTLLKNEGRPGLGYFTNVTEQAGVVGSADQSKQGLAAGDIDNDGDIDMVIGMGKSWKGLLYLNNNNGTFSENEALIMVGGGITEFGRCVSMLDYDNDGWLDVLFERAPQSTSIDTLHLFALCRNRWNGYFEDRTSHSQLGSYTKANGDVYGFAIADVDNDLDLDFFVPRMNASSLFFRNNGNGTFSEMAVGCGLPNSDYYIGAVFLDYDNDGDFDLFCKRHTFNAQLFRNEFIPTGNLFFTNVSQQAGVDIFLGNKTPDTVFGGGLNTGDFNNDGYMDILSINEWGKDIFLLRNNGNGTFTDVAGYPANLKDNNRWYWTAPISDYNHDGDLDIYMGRSPQHAYDPNNPPVSEAAALYVNAYVENGGTNKWISVKLEGGAPTPGYSNRSGIGARLLGYTQGRLQMLQVLGGNGYLVNSFWNHFGLGQASEMDSLVIYWPSGIVQRAYNIPAGTRLSISEKDSSSLYFGPLFLAGYTLYANTSSPVRQVLITMTGDSSKVKYTDVKGYYKFTPLPHGPIRLTLTATKPRGEDVDVGVISSYDAALVLQYLVGLDTLGTLQKTRGDVDQDGIITARDAFYIARYVVGITSDPGSHVGEWKFIPPSHSYTSLTKPLNSENFQASVYGDVSGNWGNPSGMPKVAFSGTPFVYVNSSKDSMEVTVGVEAFSPFLSAEFELEYDSDVLAFLGGQIAEANTGFYFVTNEIKPGLLRIALYGAHPWKKSGSLFTLHFHNLSTRSTKIQWNYAGFDEIPCRMNETQIPGLLTIQEPPPHFQLFGNYPNPFNPTTTISYRLSGSDWVRMTILSPQGREIRTLIDARQEPGVYTVVWDGRDHQGMEMASGIYLCRIKVGNSSYVHKMVKVK